MKIGKKIALGALVLGSSLIPYGESSAQNVNGYDGLRKLETKKVSHENELDSSAYRTIDFMDAYSGEKK